jgi:hypothetical protein
MRTGTHIRKLGIFKDVTVDPPGEFNIASFPLVCTSLDSYYQALKSFQGTHTYNDDKFCAYPKQDVHHKSSFCEAVKVVMSKMNESHNTPKTKELKYKDTVAHTLSLCVTTREKSDSGVNVKLNKKLTLLENYECLV